MSKHRMGRTVKAPDKVDKRAFGRKRLFRKVPVGELEKLASTLIEWVDENDDALSLEQFCVIQKISKKSVDDWRKRCVFLDEGIEYAKMVIGVRREIGMLFRKLEPRYTAWCLHYYLPRWDKANEYHAALQSKFKDDTSIELIKEIYEEVHKKHIIKKEKDDLTQSDTASLPSSDT